MTRNSTERKGIFMKERGRAILPKVNFLCIEASFFFPKDPQKSHENMDTNSKWRLFGGGGRDFDHQKLWLNQPL